MSPTVQTIVRIPKDLKASAQGLARRQGKSFSELLRDILQKYVAQHDMSGYIDQLWQDIGSDLRDQGYGPKDVNQVIEDYRKEKAT